MNKTKRLYKTEFKELYNKKDGKEIYHLFKQNPDLMNYLSNRECRKVNLMLIDATNSMLDEANSMLERTIEEVEKTSK